MKIYTKYINVHVYIPTGSIVNENFVNSTPYSSMKISIHKTESLRSLQQKFIG